MGETRSCEPSAAALPPLEAKLAELRGLETRLRRLKRDLLEAGVTAAEPAVERLDLLLVRSGRQVAALPAGCVDEVVQMPAVRALEQPPPGLIGLVDVHGAWLAVVDLAPLLGGPVSRVTSHQALLVCRAGDRRFTLMVDEALDVVSVPASAVTVSDEVLPGALQPTGILSWEQQCVSVFDGFSVALTAELAEVSP